MNSNSENSQSQALASKLLDLVSNTLRLNDILRDVCDDIENGDVCNEIEKKLKFDFAAIQLIRQEQNIIETVVGAEWVGLPRHYLAKDPDLRDIQADIAQTCRTEIIAGYDKRFDRGVYEQFSHESMVRIFTPILLIKKEDGELIRDWFDRCKFEVSERKKEKGQHTIIEIDLSPLKLEENKTLIEVVGTVEVGRKDPPSSTIEPKEAEQLIKLVGKKAIEEIDPYLFSSVLRDLASIIKEEVGGDPDTSSLFFNIKPIQDSYIHEIERGKIKQSYLKIEENQIPYTYKFPSRSIPWSDLRDCRLLLGEDSFGKKVIDEKKSKYITNQEQLTSSNPKALKLGIKAMAVFPLIHEQGKVKDVQYLLSLYFKNENPFDGKELEQRLKSANDSLNQGFNVIQQIITFQNSKKQYSQLLALKTGLDSVIKTLDKKELLHYIAWNTLNLLATDIVMIYEYIDTDNAQKVFPCERVIAGKLKNKDQVSTELDKLIKNPPEQLDELIKNPPEQEKNPPEQENDDSSPRYLNNVLIDLNPISQNLSFLNPNDEYIKSTYAIVLRSKYRKKVVEEVMVINYRRPYEFSKNEKQFIEELANIAAIAIYDQQHLILDRQEFSNYAYKFDRVFERAYEQNKLGKLEQANKFADDFFNFLNKKNN